MCLRYAQKKESRREELPDNALRKDTITYGKKKLRMPDFTLEKMGDQQIRGLREYITAYPDKESVD